MLGEDLLIVASKFSGFDKTRDRPDRLALHRADKLVVIGMRFAATFAPLASS